MSTRGYPNVWSNFERIVEDGRMLKFEIEDIPESMWSTAVEFMLGNYIREDVWWKAAGEHLLVNWIPELKQSQCNESVGRTNKCIFFAITKIPTRFAHTFLRKKIRKSLAVV